MIRRIILMPIYIIVQLFRIILDMTVRISAWIFYALAGMFLLVTICCYYMQIESSEGIHQMLIGCGILFIIPQAATVLSGIIEFAAEVLGDRIRR